MHVSTRLVSVQLVFCTFMRFLNKDLRHRLLPLEYRKVVCCKQVFNKPVSKLVIENPA